VPDILADLSRCSILEVAQKVLVVFFFLSQRLDWPHVEAVNLDSLLSSLFEEDVVYLPHRCLALL